MRAVARDAAGEVYAMVVFTVVVAPALVLLVDGDLGGLQTTAGWDLVATSTILGAAYAAISWRRLRAELTVAERRTNVWIAAFDSLVVLSLATTALLIGVLVGFADVHARLAVRGWPVVALWAGVQVAAVAVAEGVARAVFRWLERAAPTQNVR